MNKILADSDVSSNNGLLKRALELRVTAEAASTAPAAPADAAAPMDDEKKKPLMRFLLKAA